jgi:hypothetical protein
LYSRVRLLKVINTDEAEKEAYFEPSSSEEFIFQKIEREIKLAI